ncbi:hypothetical protein MXB_477 [Myxobolus squamalis]|nr:hypothetical protein MXB_477 [Myxobolus squamalis]
MGRKKKTFPAYLPLGHILEFIAELAMISYGGKVGYCRSFTLFPNLPGLAEGCKSDLEILKPDIIITVPLILEKIKKIIMSKIVLESRLKQLLFQTIYNMRAYYYSRGYDTPIINKLFFKKSRQLFGGNLKYGVIGAALVSPDTEEFINICFGTFKQAYGSTEMSAGGTFSEIDYYVPNNIGPPLGCLEIKLISWEEGGYFSDDPKHPRGELAICGLNVVSGYYKDPESTKESFFTDSETGKTWFYTGDIVELMQDGTFRFLDRKKDIIKLIHGEYVALAKIENIIMINKYVDMCCVCPNSTNSNIIALIVPNRPDLANLANKLMIAFDNVESLIQNDKIKLIIEDEIFVELKAQNLLKYEFVSAIHLVHETWTPESGLVTASMKLKRKEISKNYAQLLY